MSAVLIMLNENPDLPVDSPAAPARRAKPRGPARPETDGPFFAVEVADVPAEVAIGDERIVFHGVNKTGSGMMAEVLFKGFAHDGALHCGTRRRAASCCSSTMISTGRGRPSRSTSPMSASSAIRCRARSPAISG
jgi:hypothetical protein